MCSTATLSIVQIPAFNDNYIWLVSNGQKALVVDPGDAHPVIEYCHKHSLELAEILITHHHSDHTGGLAQLCEYYQPIIYGPARENIPLLTKRLVEGEQFYSGVTGTKISVIEVGGHTSGHIAYFIAEAAMHEQPGSTEILKAVQTADTDPIMTSPWLFCGDTLFAGGCGRLFEGTPEQMYRSLQKIAKLPENTKICCAHEYTLANLAFARAADPDNETLQAWQKQATSLREANLTTLPSDLAKEKATNPFLRCHLPALAQAASKHSGQDISEPIAVFAEIRRWKDRF